MYQQNTQSTLSSKSSYRPPSVDDIPGISQQYTSIYHIEQLQEVEHLYQKRGMFVGKELKNENYQAEILKEKFDLIFRVSKKTFNGKFYDIMISQVDAKKNLQFEGNFFLAEVSIVSYDKKVKNNDKTKIGEPEEKSYVVRVCINPETVTASEHVDLSYMFKLQLGVASLQRINLKNLTIIKPGMFSSLTLKSVSNSILKSRYWNFS